MPITTSDGTVRQKDLSFFVLEYKPSNPFPHGAELRAYLNVYINVLSIVYLYRMHLCVFYVL